jgi:hypothetical protein
MPNAEMCVVTSPAMNARLSDVQVLTVPSSVIQDTWRALREYGEERDEGFVLWLGRILGAEAIVDTAFVPPQQSIQSEDGVGYFVSTQTLFQLNVKLSQTGLKLLAQVHSHPGRAYHSTTDDAYAVVTTEGGYSIVVPNFASGKPVLSDCAVYRLENRKWRRLDARTSATRIAWAKK